MLRILQSVNIMNRAGLETMLMNYYRYMDRDIIQFDFLTHRENSGDYDEEIVNLGGKIYHAPRLSVKSLKDYGQFLDNLFALNNYSIIHSHIDSMSFFPLFFAKKNKVPVRIAHSHTTKLDFDSKFPVKFLAKLLIKNVTNVNCACSVNAGKFLFNNDNYLIIRNAIDVNKFQFDTSKRDILRNKYNLKNKFVIGHVGRFCYIKNQTFLLDVFYEVLKKKDSSILILIGQGPDYDKILKKISDLNIEDKVIIFTNRDDVQDFYQMMDIFILPSLFEGLPLVAIEAQANGLPCIISSSVSSEVAVTDSVKFFNLNCSPLAWADLILDTSLTRNSMCINQLRNNGYDIRVEAKKLESLYLNLYNGLTDF